MISTLAKSTNKLLPRGADLFPKQNMLLIVIDTFVIMCVDRKISCFCIQDPEFLLFLP